MHYLYEHQLGFHSLALGFPSIDSCNAICLQTKSGLFGVHVYGCDKFNSLNKAMENEAKAFSSFVKHHPHGSAADYSHLYSVCFHGKRGYVDGREGAPKVKDGWKKELKVYADELGYTGTISGFDLSTVPNWPKGRHGAASDSAYVEFRRVFDKVHILYKPWLQCVYTEIKAETLGDGLNYRSTNQKGDVVDKFWFNKAVRTVSTNGSGFIVTPEAIRLSFKHK